MKSILAVAVIAGFVAAEVPSHSYLPPPPNRGYTSGPPVIAARTLETHQPGDHNADHNAQHTLEQYGVNGFVRSGQTGVEHSSIGPQTRYNDEQSYDQNSAGYPRNGLDDANTTASYEANDRAYKPQISYEDSEDLARSSPAGYDANANNFRANNGYHGNEQDGGTGYHGNEQDGGHDYHGNDHNGGRPNARSNGYN